MFSYHLPSHSGEGPGEVGIETKPDGYNTHQVIWLVRSCLFGHSLFIFSGAFEQ
jgi:hypothetical protein